MNPETGLRNRKKAIEIVQKLDAFGKLPEEYQESSAAGGGFSILVVFLIIILVFYEIQYYMTRQTRFHYDVDPEYEGKIKLNIDMMLAMRCENAGADVLDMTGQGTEIFGQLEEESITFELSPQQAKKFESIKQMNHYIRSAYHSIHSSLWNSNYGVQTKLPVREDKVETVDGCRYHGSLLVNKVAGNFHITAGRSVPVFPRGHAHLSMMINENSYNFSHRIIHFSFGDVASGIINPLDGEEKIVREHNHIFQYFIEIVPTRVETTFESKTTFQYAATEQNRSISHDKGSHGMPGIFVKYDLSPLRVHVSEDQYTFIQLLIRLCGIIGGIFATSGLLHHVIWSLIEMVCCHFKWFPRHEIIRSRSDIQTPISTLLLNDINHPTINLHTP